MTNITITSIEEATNKEGKPIDGMNESRGQYWKLWKINGKYSYFGDKELDLQIGKTYDFNIEEKEYTDQRGEQRIGYTIRLSREDSETIQEAPKTAQEAPQTPTNGQQMVMDELANINKRLDSMATFLKEKL